MAGIRRNKREPETEKVLDVNASMQGTMVFKDPVNLHINGDFEGKLDTKGTLAIGQTAQVKADIDGEDISIAGRVTGNITASKRVSLIAPARVEGDIATPVLAIAEGAVLNGKCKMSASANTTSTSAKSKTMALNEVARYLEIDTQMLEEWASQKKIPAIKDNNSWKFYKEDVDNWVAKEKVGR